MVNVFTEERSLANIQKLHFIIVDDDPLVRAVLEKSFLKIDFGKDIAVIVHSFQDGVEFLESDWYDPDDKYLLLLDGIMPKMDGIEVLLRVRTDYPDRNIVVSMLSARSGEGNIIQALEKGADDYMLKPFNVPEVMARMERMAKRMLL
ncbi:MAG TPA: response regulator [Bacillaceae bacterium]